MPDVCLLLPIRVPVSGRGVLQRRLQSLFRRLHAQPNLDRRRLARKGEETYCGAWTIAIAGFVDMSFVMTPTNFRLRKPRAAWLMSERTRSLVPRKLRIPSFCRLALTFVGTLTIDHISKCRSAHGPQRRQHNACCLARVERPPCKKSEGSRAAALAPCLELPLSA